MARCNNCGKSGLFLHLKDGLCKECFVKEHQKQLVIDIEQQKKHDLYMQAWKDDQFKALQSQYYKLIEEIENDYTVLINGLGGDDTETKLENKCVQGTIYFHELVPFWKKYEQAIPHSSPPFKRLAMLRERRGDYEGAALACVQQMRLGSFGDGSKGGMRGRLARLIKKGNLSEKVDIMREANRFLEI